MFKRQEKKFVWTNHIVIKTFWIVYCTVKARLKYGILLKIRTFISFMKLAFAGLFGKMLIIDTKNITNKSGLELLDVLILEKEKK